MSLQGELYHQSTIRKHTTKPPRLGICDIPRTRDEQMVSFLISLFSQKTAASRRKPYRAYLNDEACATIDVIRYWLDYASDTRLSLLQPQRAHFGEEAILSQDDLAMTCWGIPSTTEIPMFTLKLSPARSATCVHTSRMSAPRMEFVSVLETSTHSLWALLTTTSQTQALLTPTSCFAILCLEDRLKKVVSRPKGTGLWSYLSSLFNTFWNTFDELAKSCELAFEILRGE